MTINLPPQDDEIELSIFGPGYGESVLIHLGLGEWLVVDSCVDKSTKFPAPISYLRQIGLRPNNAVKIILASHWHDDHVRGLSAIFEQCESAQFFGSAALKHKEFLTLVKSHGSQIDEGVKEFAKIIDKIVDKAKRGSAGPNWAIENTRLWFRTHPTYPGEIFALSPSSDATTLALRELSQLIPSLGAKKNRPLALTPNHAAVVLNITIADQTVILGSDLEETSDAGTGWSVIVDSPARPTSRGQVFKIPHHGSANGHQLRVWNEMLHTHPLAVLTPFVNGRVALPSKQDVQRICALTSNAFCTAQVMPHRQKKRHGALDRTIKEVVRRIRIIHNVPGHVRLRKTLSDPSSSWRVELFDGAVPLKEAVA